MRHAPAASGSDAQGTGKRSPRNATIDGLKFLAAASIIIHHVAAKSLDMSITHRYGWVLDYATYWGLTFFFMVSGYFHGSLGRKGAEWRARRAARLIGPYLAWTAFYVVFNMAWPQIPPAIDWILYRQPFTPAGVLAIDVINVIFFAGACNVLWYLPVLIACAALADIAVFSERSRYVALALALLATAVIVAVPLSLDVSRLWGYSAAPWWFAVYVLGMFVAARPPKTVPGRLSTEATALGAVLVTGLLPLFPALMGGDRAVLGWLAASLLNVLASWVLLRAASGGADPFSASRLAGGGPLVLGMYLVHTAWIVIWAIIAVRFSMSAASWIIVGTVTSVGASVATAALLRRVRWLRWAIE